MELQSGVITQDSYLKNLKSNLFSELEVFNNKFLVRNEKELSEYHSKWTNDSLHTWSRQFEYPYFFQAVSDYISQNPGKTKVRILDAGSGLTFFPYLLCEKFPQVEVVCTDYDTILNRGYDLVNKNEKSRVKFVQSDLREKVFKDGEFDIIYCVSVLEHTNAYKKIIENFHSYLSAGGHFIISFDISIDGERDIPYSGASELVQELNKTFVPANGEGLPSSDELKVGSFLTTKFIKSFNSKLLPWRSPYKNALWCLKNFKYPRFYFNLAFFCQVYRKK